MIPKRSKYIFIRTASMMFDTYDPEIRTSTDTEDIVEIFEALKGFLVAGTWSPETVDDAICELADKIRCNREYLEKKNEQQGAV